MLYQYIRRHEKSLGSRGASLDGVVDLDSFKTLFISEFVPERTPNFSEDEGLATHVRLGWTLDLA